MLGIISIGIRKCPPYRLGQEYINGVRAVGISVSTTNNQKNRSLIREVMRNTELVIHSKNEFFIYEPE